MAPLVSAAQLKRSQAATLKASTTDEQSYADALRSIYDQASRPIDPNARMPAPDLGNPDTLQSYADNIQAQWDALRAQWKTAGVSAANWNNAAMALPKLPVGGDTGAEIRSAIQAGKEVTVHQSPINSHGWTGYGYVVVDPETGAGAYLIEWKGNGGYLDRWSDGYGNGVAFALFVVSFIAAAAGVAGTLVGILAVIGVFVAIMNLMAIRLAAIEGGCGANSANFFLVIEIIALALSVIPALGAGGVALGAFLSFISGNSFTSAAPACRNLSR